MRKNNEKNEKITRKINMNKIRNNTKEKIRKI